MKLIRESKVTCACIFKRVASNGDTTCYRLLETMEARMRFVGMIKAQHVYVVGCGERIGFNQTSAQEVVELKEYVPCVSGNISTPRVSFLDRTLLSRQSRVMFNATVRTQILQLVWELSSRNSPSEQYRACVRSGPSSGRLNLKLEVVLHLSGSSSELD
jgi:hypothetical protein